MLRNCKLTTWLVGAVGAGVLAAPASALGSDQTVYDAWASHEPRLAQLRHEYDRGERHWENSSYRSSGQALRAVSRISHVVHKTKIDIGHRETSTDLGKKARGYALRALDLERAAYLNDGRAIQAFMRFDGYNYIRLHRRAESQLKRFRSKTTQARKTFKSAGVSLKPVKK